jgi:hypothetical protein
MPHPLASPAGRHVPARDLEEVKFWLEVMREHALFIKNGLSVVHADLISEADDYYRRFGDLVVRANRVNSEKLFNQLISDTLAAVRKFYRFKRRLVRMAITCKLHSCLFPLMLDHFSREALYFIRILERINDSKPSFYKASMIREMLFWLRIMSDHIRFIRQMLDPSQTGLIETAEEFIVEFDDLYLQARDYASLLGVQGDVPSFDRFILDVRAAVLRLRDFKRALYQMIVDCRAIGLIPAELAEHVRDEADHFLIVLAMMEKGLIECVAGDVAADLLDEEIIVDEEVEGIAVAPVSVPQYEVAGIVATDCEEYDDEMEVEETVAGVAVELDEDEIDDDDDCVPEPPKPVSTPKYKWGGKWPRPLGKTEE